MDERWLPVVGYEGLYEVSDLGRVRSVEGRTDRCGRKHRGIVLRPAVKKRGHLFVVLSRDGATHPFDVHRIVLTAFVGPRPDGMCCRHWPDRDPSNNRLTNLSWGTYFENVDDSRAHGTIARGESHGMAKLSADDVRRAFAMRSQGVPAIRIAADLGISESHIYDILKGARWKHLGLEVT